ncbi:MAG TPA: hypothetical protein VGO62_09865, partial [Myxococcota bacterium]
MRALACLLLALIVVDGCNCGKAEDDGSKGKPLGQELVPRRVPDTNIVVSLPKGWLIDMPNPGPLPAPKPTAKIVLNTRKLLEARP